MSARRHRIPAELYKLAVITVVTVVLTGIMATLIGNISLVSARSFYAVFTDATGVHSGDAVRLSGVSVGSVKKVEIIEDGERRLAKVEFTVEDDVPLFRSATLQLRYENLVGQRYLAISQQAGDGDTMPSKGTFPVEQTTPALNLTQLFNGFQPLFQALDPEQVNDFSMRIIQVLQGEATTVQGLAHDLAGLSNSLADRDQVIGQVVTNLNAVLGTVATRDHKLTALIVSFRDLMRGLDKDKDGISDDLGGLDELLGSVDDLVTVARPPLRRDVRHLKTLSAQLSGTRTELEESLKRTPGILRMLARTGSYGSWFNFYVCGLEIKLTLLDGEVNLGGPAVASNERDTVCGAGGRP